MNRRGGGLAALLATLVLSATPGTGRTADDLTAVDLAREDQNPITRFYVMRLEDNAQMGFGPDDEALNFFRIQPLVPFDLNDDWSVVVRGLIPIAHQPWPDSTDGLSDVAVAALLTPATTRKLVWGAGPALLLPTATDKDIGTEKWSAGPAFAAVYTSGPWVMGGIIQNLWSFAGDDDRSAISTMALRPLLNYNLPDGWYLSSSPSIAANWKAKRDNRWLVPLGGGVGKVFTLGNQRMSLLVESYYHVVSPEIGPDWQLRVQVSFLYPD